MRRNVSRFIAVAILLMAAGCSGGTGKKEKDPPELVDAQSVVETFLDAIKNRDGE